MNIYGNAAAVISHRNGVVLVESDPNMFGVSGESLVYGIVSDFPDEMMQAFAIGGSDVHSGALSDRFQPFQNLNRRSIVLTGGFGHYEAILAILEAERKVRKAELEVAISLEIFFCFYNNGIYL